MKISRLEVGRRWWAVLRKLSVFADIFRNDLSTRKGLDHRKAVGPRRADSVVKTLSRNCQGYHCCFVLCKVRAKSQETFDHEE